MITHARIKPEAGKVWLVAIVAALFAGTCLAFAKDGPGAEGAKVSEVTKEDLLSRIPNFFSFDYPYEPQPGKRLWLRVDDKHWIERYPDGMESRFEIVGRTTARGGRGTIVMKIEGDPEKTGTDNDGGFQVFIPDKENKEKPILFRYVGQGNAEWQDMSWSDNKKTEIKSVE